MAHLWERDLASPSPPTPFSRNSIKKKEQDRQDREELQTPSPSTLRYLAGDRWEHEADPRPRRTTACSFDTIVTAFGSQDFNDYTDVKATLPTFAEPYLYTHFLVGNLVFRVHNPLDYNDYRDGPHVHLYTNSVVGTWDNDTLVLVLRTPANFLCPCISRSRHAKPNSELFTLFNSRFIHHRGRRVLATLTLFVDPPSIHTTSSRCRICAMLDMSTD